jgi:hypothetical protein
VETPNDSKRGGPRPASQARSYTLICEEPLNATAPDGERRALLPHAAGKPVGGDRDLQFLAERDDENEARGVVLRGRLPALGAAALAAVVT